MHQGRTEAVNPASIMPTPENPNSTQLHCESCGTHFDSSEHLKAHTTSCAAAEVTGSKSTGSSDRDWVSTP
jgi:hypothetical protein